MTISTSFGICTFTCNKNDWLDRVGVHMGLKKLEIFILFFLIIFFCSNCPCKDISARESWWIMKKEKWGMMNDLFAIRHAGLVALVKRWQLPPRLQHMRSMCSKLYYLRWADMHWNLLTFKKKLFMVSKHDKNILFNFIALFSVRTKENVWNILKIFGNLFVIFDTFQCNERTIFK